MQQRCGAPAGSEDTRPSAESGTEMSWLPLRNRSELAAHHAKQRSWSLHGCCRCFKVSRPHADQLLCNAQRGWELRDGRVFFQPPEQTGVHDLNALEVISNSMTYARELERIV